MKFQKQIGTHTIVTYCAENLTYQVQELFKKLVALNNKGPKLKDGTIIRFGWSDLKLEEYDKELVVMEPDFAGDALHNHLPQVTITLDVLAQQVDLLKRIGIEGNTTLFSEKLIIAKNSLQKRNIYLERMEIDEERSEWYIGEVDNQKEILEDDLEAMYVFEILRKRYDLMKYMALPVGYIVVLQNEEIKAILNDRNVNVWP